MHQPTSKTQSHTLIPAWYPPKSTDAQPSLALWALVALCCCCRCRPYCRTLLLSPTLLLPALLTLLSCLAPHDIPSYVGSVASIDPIRLRRFIVTWIMAAFLLITAAVVHIPVIMQAIESPLAALSLIVTEGDKKLEVNLLCIKDVKGKAKATP